MASGTVKKETKPFAVSTGITGVSAIKSGNMVTLTINVPVSDTTAGWKTIGTLPESLAPSFSIILFCGYDNNTGSYLTNVIQDCQIQGRTISAYLFSGHLSIDLRATVTYPTSN